LHALRNRAQAGRIMVTATPQTAQRELFPRATLTVAQAAEILGIPRRTFYLYVAQGIIPCVHVGRRKILILRETIDQLLSTGAYPAGAEATTPEGFARDDREW
jgi:excisionase family DNA binding protein